MKSFGKEIVDEGYHYQQILTPKTPTRPLQQHDIPVSKSCLVCCSGYKSSQTLSIESKPSSLLMSD